MTVIVNRAMTGGGRSRTGAAIPLSVLLWPPFLAGVVASHVIGAISALAPEWMPETPLARHMTTTALTGVLIPVFVFAYGRRLSLARPDGADGSGVRRILLMVAGVQIFACVGSEILRWFIVGYAPLDGAHIIMLATVMLALWNTFRSFRGA
ncbi:MAG: hypothetical protein ACK5MQ_17500 [Pikeienuella sp.]